MVCSDGSKNVRDCHASNACPIWLPTGNVTAAILFACHDPCFLHSNDQFTMYIPQAAAVTCGWIEQLAEYFARFLHVLSMFNPFCSLEMPAIDMSI